MDRLSAHDITTLMLALGLLLAVARILGELAQALRQPAVVGELLAGILLGPTVLGQLAPALSVQLFPRTGPVALVLDGLSTLAIALFLLVAGMEVELSTIWKQGRTALTVGLAGIIVPFALGLSSALIAPYAMGCEQDANVWLFALFFATALSISALPVIAKTLMDLGLYRSDLGMIVVAAAIFNDLLGWIIFALILGMMSGSGTSWGIACTIVMTLGFAVLMLTVGRWLIHRLLPFLQAYTTWPGGVLGAAFSLALFGAALTEWIGIHAIFGSFLVGVAIGDSNHLREHTRNIILQFVSFIFAPLFFATIGLKVNFLENLDVPLIVLVVLIACVGKIAGCGVAAQWAGLDRRTSWAIGFSMNARGAMEIILGMLALQAGLIRQRMFVALVIMAVVTSIMSGPMIQQLLNRRRKVRLAHYLISNAFFVNLTAHTRRDAISELAKGLSLAARRDADQIEEAVLAREQMMTTALTDCIAVPHARLDGLHRAMVGVGISRGGIDFDAADGQPAHLIFLLLTPTDDHGIQLDLLADIARLFGRNPALRAMAMEVNSYTEFIAMLKTDGSMGGAHA